MKQEKITKENVLQWLCQFVDQRPGIEFVNYADGTREGVRMYRREAAEVTRDRTDFYNLLSVCQRRLDRDKLNEAIYNELKNTSGRLRINENDLLEYCTGQYFPTEYRPAACRVLVSILWNDYRNEKWTNNGALHGKPFYETGHEIRRAIKRNFGRRINSNYFN